MVFSPTFCGPLAHLVEHRPFKPGVAGSSPARPTILYESSNYSLGLQQ